MHSSPSNHHRPQAPSTSACLAHQPRHRLVGSRMEHRALAVSAVRRTPPMQASRSVVLATLSRNRTDSIRHRHSASGRAKILPAHQAHRSALDRLIAKSSRNPTASSPMPHLDLADSSRSSNIMAGRLPSALVKATKHQSRSLHHSVHSASNNNLRKAHKHQSLAYLALNR